MLLHQAPRAKDTARALGAPGPEPPPSLEGPWRGRAAEDGHRPLPGGRRPPAWSRPTERLCSARRLPLQCVPTTLDSSPLTAAQADPGAQGTARGSSLPGSGAQHSASPPHCPQAGSAERHHVTRSGSAPSRQRLGPRSSLQARAAQEASIPPRRLDLLAVGWSVTEKRRPCRGDRGRGGHGRTQPPAEPAQRRGGWRAADTVWTQGQQRRFRPCVWGDRAPTPTSHPPAFPEVTS